MQKTTARGSMHVCMSEVENTRARRGHGHACMQSGGKTGTKEILKTCMSWMPGSAKTTTGHEGASSSPCANQSSSHSASSVSLEISGNIASAVASSTPKKINREVDRKKCVLCLMDMNHGPCTRWRRRGHVPHVHACMHVCIRAMDRSCNMRRRRACVV